MSLIRFINQFRNPDHKLTLLYRFHISVIIVNILAIGIDTFFERYFNALIELAVVVLLLLNFWWLKRHVKVKEAAFVFLAIISSALFTLIAINHFATMSVVFVLLLPLTTLLFIRFKHSLMIETALFIIMALLLYVEHLNNPVNPLVQNPQALFNLAYAAVIIYIFGLLYHFSIIKTFDELDASNRQKELLLKEVHHRVKNNLNVIASIIGLQANTLNGSEKEQLSKSKTRIESMAIVHEMLYKSDDLENIDFESYMRRLSSLLLGMYAKNQTVDVEIHASKEHMPLEVMIQLGIIANELVTNSIKYAFEDEKGTITIELHHHNNHFTFVYYDDGIGSQEPQKLLERKSLGIKLIHLATRQLHGTVKLSSPNGLRYDIEFTHE
jgi:two-component sensor histidine kinase